MIQNEVLELLDTAFSKCASPNNTERQTGQNELRALKSRGDYSIALLNYIHRAPNPEKGLRAAIELKLWMAAYRQLQLFQIQQYLGIIEEVKSRIIDLYLEATPQIAYQLSEALVNLAAMEFPDRWQQLMKVLSIKANENAGRTLRVLTMMTMLTYRYTYSTRSDPLYLEIILVCDDTHDFLLRVTDSALECVLMPQLDLQNIYVIIRTAMRLFYNLNYQDLHPLFEDNLRRWMDILIKVMRLPGQALQLLKAKSETLKCILLYASKYKEDIQPIIKDFSEEIWKLCSTTKGDDQISEKIQLIALKYFKHLVVWQDMKPFLAQHLQTLLQTLIFPSIGLNKTAAAMFQDEPMLFIQNYFQNSQINTRRSTAVDLLKSITKSYDLSELIKKQLVEFVQTTQTQGHCIQAECLLLNLVVDSGTVAFRSVDGVTQISITQDIIRYVYLQIVKPFFSSVYEWATTNLHRKVQSHFNLIHLSLHMRYVFFFRLYVPKEDLQIIVRFCCCLNTNSETFRSIVCMMLQAIIDIKFGDYTYYSNLVPYFDQEKLDTLAFEILKMIFTNQQQQKELNKYLTKTLFVLCKRLQQRSVKYADHFMAVISNMLKRTHSYDFKCVVFLFEAFSTLVYSMLIQNVDIKAVEAIIDTYFSKLLSQGSDLLNFIFQVYSLIVQLKGNLSETYTNLYQSVLSSENWAITNNSLFSAYIQYLISYLKKHPTLIVSNKPQISLILSQLVDLRGYRHFSSFLFGILQITSLDGFFSSGYLAILMQGTTASLNQLEQKTPILKPAILMFCSIIVDYDAKKLVQYSNQINLYYVENLMIQGLSIISMIQLRDERRLVFHGISKLIGLNLLSSIEKWASMLNALIQNTNRRYIGRTTSLGDNQDSDSAYQKLSVFPLLQNKQSNLTNDQQKFFVDSFKQVYAGMQGKVNIAHLIPEKSQEQLTRLINKFQQI